MSTRLVDLILTSTPPGDILRSLAARLEELAEHADHGRQGALVQDGVDIARAFMDATGWRPEYEMTGVPR